MSNTGEEIQMAAMDSDGRIPEHNADTADQMPNTADEILTVAIDIEELRRTMKADLRTFGRRSENKDPCTIYRVFHSVRREHEQHYHPQIIGIGLFHHRDDAFRPMEQLKWSYLRDLIHRNRRRGATFDRYIDAVNGIKAEARSCYSEPPELDDAFFVRMMVLDGGFLLEFLIKAYMDENKSYLDEVNWNLPLMRRDLLLLENQIPFLVLQVLLDSSDIQDLDGFHDDGTRLTLMNLVVSYVTRNMLETLPEEEQKLKVTHHLLHVYHASICQTLRSADTPTKFSCRLAVRRTLRVMTIPFLWLLSCFLNCGTPLMCCEDPKSKKTRAPRGTPTATQLKESGVKFKKRKGATSILDVRFDKEEGVMEIPMVSIQEATISLYRNLIAFEQCCPKTGSHFTSYATLMNNLIDTEADVAILKDIIESKLGEDREVAELFNNLCKGAYLSYEDHHLRPVFEDVVAYANIDHHKWRAGLMHNYFGNPWAIISLIAATILLCLTFLQTFYAVYAYHHPS